MFAGSIFRRSRITADSASTHARCIVAYCGSPDAPWTMTT
jgi:hypothetical protein